LQDMDKRLGRNYQYGDGDSLSKCHFPASSWPFEFAAGDCLITVASPGYA